MSVEVERFDVLGRISPKDVAHVTMIIDLRKLRQQVQRVEEWSPFAIRPRQAVDKIVGRPTLDGSDYFVKDQKVTCKELF